MREETGYGRKAVMPGKMTATLLLLALLFFASGGSMGVALGLGHLCHGDSDCPDSGSDGIPCGPNCPCSCCPGHRVMPAIASLPLFLVSPALTGTVQPEDKAPSQKDIPFTIFRPPEA